MVTKVRKLYNNCVEVRDYIVKKALANQENLIVLFDNERMTIPYRSLHKGRKTLQQHSRFSNEKYWLLAYKWVPDLPKQPEGQLELK